MNGEIYQGNSITVPFAREGILKSFEIQGKSVQETIGKNLLNVPNEFIVAQVVSNIPINMPIGTYVISVDEIITDGPLDKFLFYFYYDDNTTLLKSLSSTNKTITFTTEKPITKLNIYSQDLNANSIGITTTYRNLMISKEGGEYEPYKTIPSPEYPSEIQSVADDINLFDRTAEPGIMALGGPQVDVLDTGIKLTAVTNGQYKYVGFELDTNKILGKTITVSANMLASALNQPLLSLYWHNNGTLTNRAGLTDIAMKNSGTSSILIPNEIPEGSTGLFILFYVNQDGTAEIGDYVEYTNIKVQIGNKATLYSKYNKGTIEIKQTGNNLLKGLNTSVNDNSYWHDVNRYYFTPLEDGWGKFEYDNINGTSTVFINAKVKKDAIKLKENTKYTIVTEIRNSNISENSGAFFQLITNNPGTCSSESKSLGYPFVNSGGIYKSVIKTKENFNNTTISIDTYLRLAAGTKGTVEARMSLFEGDIDIANFEYELYKENNYIIQTTPLRSLPNGIKDTIEEDGIHRRVKSVSVKINSIITLSNGNIGGVFDIPDKVFKLEQNIICSRAKVIKNFEENTVYENPANVVLVGNSTDTLETIKAKFDGAELIYELAEEVVEFLETPITFSVFSGNNNFTINDELEPVLLINTADFAFPETPGTDMIPEDVSARETHIGLEIWSHEDEFIDILYNTDYDFEGQCIDPKMTLNANGTKTLTLDLPLYIIDKKTQNRIENPRWTYIKQQYKIRVQQDNNINEFVLVDYTENHDSNDQLMISINAQSLEEFELSQIGYNIIFNEDTLYKYNLEDDPTDPDTIPIGTYTPDIHFWNEKLLENSDWNYRVESYYPIDKDMKIDNRQVENPILDYKNGKEQLYENDRIVDYTEENEPIYADEYEIKKRVIKIEKSNIFNIVQDICEAFECWPTFEIKYNKDKIVSKTIVYKNDVPQDGTFSINYQTNLNSIQRTVDNSQIVTKMYVTTIENENVDNGIISISTNPKNFMKENYLLDLSWYLGEERPDTDLENSRLINPKIGMEFKKTNFIEPEYEGETTTTTKDTISTYQKNIRNRNTFIENLSLKLSQHQEEFTNLKTEREYVQSQKDSAQENINNLIDEMNLIGETELRKENKTCYLYIENNKVIVRFSEVGIKSVPRAETFSTPINIVDLSGVPYVDANKVGQTGGVSIKQMKLVPHKLDPIIGTILECEITNATINKNSNEDYASFKCSFDYDPYTYYKKLISYWETKVQEANTRLETLGKVKSEGGTSGLIFDIEEVVSQEKKQIYQAQQEKSQLTIEFESKFTPYIREGYWENTDFAIYTNETISTIYDMNEKKKLKYGQTEESTSNELEKYDWTDDYICYKIPNISIEDNNGKTVSLYDVIDIEELEVMNDNPLNENDYFKTYIKGTDYTVEYGYSSSEPGVADSERGIFICFYEPKENTNMDYVPQFDVDTLIYLKIKMRGTTQYIWSDFVEPQSFIINEEKERSWYCPLEQRITLEDKDIVLSSVIIKSPAQIPTYTNEGNLVFEDGEYELRYGRDYYTSKEIEDNVTVSRITFYQTTNVPLKSSKESAYIVDYNQDVTAKYYYNDALEVMKESSVPQTTYSISVLDISEAQNFLSNLKWYKPKVGTRVPIYDEELRFKGLVGFINTVTFDLLKPENTEISITNFKDKFVDLFQKITASTIALQSKEYTYDRSTQIVTIEGGINEQILKDTFERPDSNFRVTQSANICWNSTGIVSTSPVKNENGVQAQLKVTPTGIYTANKKDNKGDYVWTTAITPQGINASQLTLGKLDTRQIQIFNSSEPRFLWNENGLYAYGQNEGKTDYETYVLYNENGIKFRQLMTSQKSVTLTNLVNSSTFADLTHWNISSSNEEALISKVPTVIEEEEIVGGEKVSVLKASIGDNAATDIKINLDSTKEEINETHQYYFRFYVKTSAIPETTKITIRGGFSGFHKEVQSSQSNKYIKVDGFITGPTNINNFNVEVILPEEKSNWSIFVKKPLIIDVTKTFGTAVPSLQWFNDLQDIAESYIWTDKPLNLYGDALKLDWGGLSIGAQNNTLQLTSDNGLIIYHPIGEVDDEKRVRLQLGQWEEDGEEIYGLRAFGLDNNPIFKITQYGVSFDFTNDLEQTIVNISTEAAINAVGTTEAANLLKNSCGYLYSEETQEDDSFYYYFFDWLVGEDGKNQIFPINESITENNSTNPIVTGTLSKHAFALGYVDRVDGDTTKRVGPTLSQTVNIASKGIPASYSLGFKIKSPVGENNQTKITFITEEQQSGIEFFADSTNDGSWSDYNFTVETAGTLVTIKIENSSKIVVLEDNIATSGIVYLSDLMFTSGDKAPPWTVSAGEVYNNHVTIGSSGIHVTSDSQGGVVTRTTMDSHSFRVESTTRAGISTNILVTGDSTTLGNTAVKGTLDVGINTHLKFVEYNDLDGDDDGVDIVLIKG